MASAKLPRYRYAIEPRFGKKKMIKGLCQLRYLKNKVPDTLFSYLTDLAASGRLNKVKLIHQDCICQIEKVERPIKKSPAA